MFICICNSITDREIREAVDSGAQSLDDLRDQLGVASCCGTCACAAESLLTGGAGSAARGHAARGTACAPSLEAAAP